MSAAAIAAALGDARREGRGWRCRCPVHGGRSLILRDGDSGRLLVWCFGGCDARHVLQELRDRGVPHSRRDEQLRTVATTRHHDAACDAAHTARGLALWREAQPVPRTIAEVYLAHRGVLLSDLPAEARGSLRYHPRCLHPSGTVLPAMVALVEHHERGVVAVHRTYLRADGTGKAQIAPSKASLGPVGGAAVRFGMPSEGRWFSIAEGLETTLTVIMACAMPAWAALSAGGMRSLVLPREATHIVIAADNDINGVGNRAARDAAERFLAEGRRVRIAMPIQPGTDFNDMLNGVASAQIGEIHHVA